VITNVMASGKPRSRRRRLVLGLAVVAWAVALVAGGWYALTAIRIHNETERVAARFDPPVWAGQNVTTACPGGFSARQQQTVVILLSAHCAQPGIVLRDGDGRQVGLLGPRAQLTDCPTGRFCSPSDFLTLALAADRVPWGHLNMVDMGAGGYRTFGPDTRAFACADIKVGARVEIDGRERYRTGVVLAVEPYEYETDTMFPCMAIADIEVGVGDSGGAVLVDGQPAGIIARDIANHLGFTPLAEGLENLGLVLCTTPDCDLSPSTVVQPTG